MNKLRYNMDVTAKNNKERKNMEIELSLINSLYPTGRARQKLIKEIQEDGIQQVAHRCNFNLRALGIIYNGYMIEKEAKKEKKVVKKEKQGYSNFVVPEQLVTSVEMYHGNFYLISGQTRRKVRGERFAKEEDALKFIYEEALELLTGIQEYAESKNLWKRKLSKVDYEFACKWEYYFNHLDIIKQIDKLNVSMDQHLYLRELLTGDWELDNHKKHKGRAVDFRKLNDVKYSFSETKEDIDILCQIVQNYGISNEKKKGKKRK